MLLGKKTWNRAWFIRMLYRLSSYQDCQHTAVLVAWIPLTFFGSKSGAVHLFCHLCESCQVSSAQGCPWWGRLSAVDLKRSVFSQPRHDMGSLLKGWNWMELMLRITGIHVNRKIPCSSCYSTRASSILSAPLCCFPSLLEQLLGPPAPGNGARY